MTYNKTKTWNLASSFPGNSLNELQVRFKTSHYLCTWMYIKDF